MFAFRRWSWALVLVAASLVAGDVTINKPLMQQLPPIAHPDEPFSFTISPNTFAFVVPSNTRAPASPPSISYSTHDLPSWLTFNPNTLTFAGTVPAEDDGKQFRVTVTGSMPADTPSTGGNTTATDNFTILVLDEPVPTVKIPFSEQFPAASSLGQSNMLAPETIHLPLGWSFSIGLRGDTFDLSNGANVYWSVNLQGGEPLPSWLRYQPDSFDFYGNAPTDVGERGGDTFVVVVTGSNRPGYGGVSQSFTLTVSTHSLALRNGLPTVNATIGEDIELQIPINGLRADGSRLADISTVSASASIAPSLSWLTFDTASRTLSGTVPFAPYGNASSVTQLQIPISFAGPNDTKVTVNQTINIAPSAFTALELPNVFITQGKMVDVELRQFLRNITASSSSKRTLDRRAPSSSGNGTLAVSLTPSNASSWLHFDSSMSRLSGQVPEGWADRVKVDLTSQQRRSNTTSNASFYLAFNGDNAVGNPTAGNTNWSKGSGEGDGGLSAKSKIAIGASIGGAFGLIALLCLLFCCRRRSEEGKDYDRSQSTNNSRDDDEGTLTDKGTRQWKKAIVVGRAGVGEMHTPSTAAVSPMPGFEGEKMEEAHTLTPPRNNDLHSVVVVSPNGGRRDAMHEAEAPMQSRLIANLFTGGRAHPPSSAKSKKANKGAVAAASAAAVNGTGLGLSLGDTDPSDPFAGPPATADSRGRISHRRSRESVNSHRSSWESDLFYEDAPSTEQTHGSGGHHTYSHEVPLTRGQEEDLPRRRGKPTSTGLNVRHRNTHINESPNFQTPDVFTPSALPAGGSAQSLDRIGMTAMDSGLSGGSDFHDSQTNLSASAMQDDARILKARVMQVQRHSPILHQGANNPVTAHAAAARSYDVSHGGGAFDDAEDDIEWTNDSAYDAGANGAIRDRGKTKEAKRNSTMSALTDGSHLAGVRAHFAQEAAMEHRPSFMDGASISGIDPHESMKPVGAVQRPKTPPTSKPYQPRTPTSKRAPGSAGSAASGRFLPCPTVNAVMGHLLRFKLYPNVPPPMAGAPSSPGKRSGRTVRYELVMDDDRPHLAKYKGLWPDMLADWLTINTSTFEVDGVVPRAAELEQLGDCQIALISTTRISGNAVTSPEGKRTSTSSYESAGRASISNDEERTVVARSRLIFQNPAPRGYVPPRFGQAF